MKTLPLKQARSSLWWTVMALAASSSTLGVAQAQTSRSTEGTASIESQTDWKGQRKEGGFMTGRALNAVDASADQRSWINAIMEQAASDLKTQRAQSRNLRAQLTGLMTAAAVDTQAIEKLRQEMLAVQNAVSRGRVQAQMAALAVLSPAQREQLGAEMTRREHLM